MRSSRGLIASIAFVAVVVAGTVSGFLFANLKPLLGLDLVGGARIVLTAPEGTDREVMNRALETIRNRVDAFGVAEPDIAIVGDRNIEVQIPGLQKEVGGAARQNRLLQLIGSTARLEEREVLQTILPGDPAYDKAKVTCPATPLPSDRFCDPESPTFKASEVVCPPTTSATDKACSNEALATKELVFTGDDGTTKYRLGKVEITGDAIKGAQAVFQTSNQSNVAPTEAGWIVSFQLTGDGAKTFGTVTTRLQGKQLAIILDRRVESAPTVQQPITDGRGQITGNFSETEAKDLALTLRTGALPVELTKSQLETVSPTLGKESLHAGLLAGIVGLIALMVYLAFYYRVLGMVTWIGMAIWGTLAIGLVSLLGRTWGYSLTLAGVAGIVVSLGITADSYIVYYERLKDEVRHGKTLRVAVVPAFKRAWKTIVAADIVTILAAVVLYLLSIGSVRGFALTLGLATALDMFVVYFFKRPTVNLIARSNRLANMRGIGLRSGVAADPLPVMGGER